MDKAITFFGTCNGNIVKLSNVGYMSQVQAGKWRSVNDPLPTIVEKICVAFGGGKPREYDYAVGLCACGNYHFAERRIERPAHASNHQCGGRCRSAKGRVCECSCQGAHHGAGF